MRIAAVTAALLLTLTGCAGTPATPSPSQTSGPVPTTAAAPDLIVGSSGFRVVAESGEVLVESTWFADPDETIALLTAALGAAPTPHPYDGNAETASGTDWEWDGFALRVLDDDAVDPYHPILSVVDDSIDGLIDVTLENGLRVGSTEAEAQAAAPVGVVGDPLAWYAYDAVELRPLDGTNYRATTQAQVDLGTGVVVRLAAPVVEYF